MRTSRFGLSTGLLAVGLCAAPARANPLPKDVGGLTWNALFGRGGCANSCGWDGQLCCAAGEACYTDANNQAQCTQTSAQAITATKTGPGYWEYWTSTYVETDTELVTRYSTGSSWCGSATATGTTTTATSVWVAATSTAPASCNTGGGDTSCGSICCASDQYCYASGQCVAYGTTSRLSSASTTGISPALLPTSSTLVIVTATSSPTTTVPFTAPVATGASVTLSEASSSNSGLSGGAIAGIVIGVLAGIALLILLCLYCCARGIWNLLFGGRRRRERTEYVEEHHHTSYGGGAYAGGGSRSGDRRWYGSGPRREKKSENKGFGNLLGIGAGLAGLAAVLGMKRRADRKHRDEKSDLGSGYTDASYSYYTSESSASSDDRRTRATRDTRRSSRHR